MLDMNVRVGQPGQDGFAAHVLFFHFTAREAFQFIPVPYSDDPPAGDQDRGSVWLFWIKRMNVSVIKEFHVSLLLSAGQLVS